MLLTIPAEVRIRTLDIVQCTLGSLSVRVDGGAMLEMWKKRRVSVMRNGRGVFISDGGSRQNIPDFFQLQLHSETSMNAPRTSSASYGGQQQLSPRQRYSRSSTSQTRTSLLLRP
jgi:hypothetical protein